MMTLVSTTIFFPLTPHFSLSRHRNVGNPLFGKAIFLGLFADFSEGTERLLLLMTEGLAQPWTPWRINSAIERFWMNEICLRVSTSDSSR